MPARGRGFFTGGAIGFIVVGLVHLTAHEAMSGGRAHRPQPEAWSEAKTFVSEKENPQ